MEYIERIGNIAVDNFEDDRRHMTFGQLGAMLDLTAWQAGQWVGRAWHHYEAEGDTYTASCIMFVFRYKDED